MWAGMGPDCDGTLFPRWFINLLKNTFFNSRDDDNATDDSELKKKDGALNKSRHTHAYSFFYNAS